MDGKNYYKDVWEMLDKCQFDIDSKATANLKCIICNNLLMDAHEAPCGCNFCKKCIRKSLMKKKYCPGTGSDCKRSELSFDTNIICDTATNKKILQLKTKCPQKLCTFRGDLSKIFLHLNQCDKFKTEMNEYLREKSDRIEKENIELKKELKLVRQKSLKEKQAMQKDLLNLRNLLIDTARKIEVSEEKVGSFEWTINEILNKIKRYEWIKSDYFYSSDRKYEMWLYFIGGGCKCCSKYNKVSFCINFYIGIGPNSNPSSWPLKCTVTLTAVGKTQPGIKKTVSRNCQFPHPVTGQCEYQYEIFHCSDLSFDQIELSQQKSISFLCRIDHCLQK